MLSDIIRYCQKIVRYFQGVLNAFRYCKILLDIVGYCQIFLRAKSLLEIAMERKKIRKTFRTARYCHILPDTARYR